VLSVRKFIFISICSAILLASLFLAGRNNNADEAIDLESKEDISVLKEVDFDLYFEPNEKSRTGGDRALEMLVKGGRRRNTELKPYEGRNGNYSFKNISFQNADGKILTKVDIDLMELKGVHMNGVIPSVEVVRMNGINVKRTLILPQIITEQILKELNEELVGEYANSPVEDEIKFRSIYASVSIDSVSIARPDINHIDELFSFLDYSYYYSEDMDGNFIWPTLDALAIKGFRSTVWNGDYRSPITFDFFGLAGFKEKEQCSFLVSNFYGNYPVEELDLFFEGEIGFGDVEISLKSFSAKKLNCTIPTYLKVYEN